GKIYSLDKVDQALRNFFTTSNLTALREVALRQVADTVEVENGENGIRERVLVALSLDPEGTRLIRRGGRIAERLKATLDVVHVSTRPPTRDDARQLQVFQAIAQAMGGEFRVLPNARGIARELIAQARQGHYTQIVVGESRPRLWRPGGTLSERLIRETEGADVTVIARAKRGG
ncbi:MAG TPA: universal stress protein, partial [Deinococcales bacterium]|nr:universal stress protein [Deinococcales bacterium]